MLRHLYGRDTRSVRVLNLLVELVWVYLIITHLAGFATVHLPETIKPSFNLLLVLMVTNIVITCFTFSNFNFKERLGYISLTLGSLVQTIIGLKFASSYPPFDTMVITCTLLALWFIGGAFYLGQKAKEGNDESRVDD